MSIPEDKDPEDDDKTARSQPLRRAAAQAQDKITKHLSDQEAVAIFSFPQECHGD